jgi:hypothetical protein
MHVVFLELIAIDVAHVFMPDGDNVVQIVDRI